MPDFLPEPAFPSSYTCLVILGPTAVGKTPLGVQLARHFKGEVLSADSRQVYRGLDLGSGKDLNEFTLHDCSIPYHLIDIADLSYEYSVFDYQQDFYRAFADVQDRSVLPIVVGGTGMYLDAIIRSYELLRVPINDSLRLELAQKTQEELTTILTTLKTEKQSQLHNDTDLTERHRLLRAIEIEMYTQSPEAMEKKRSLLARPDIRPLIIGTTFPRDILRSRIRRRLEQRMNEGLVEEVEALHRDGTSWERLERLGLEYRFIAEFLQGKIASREELFTSLSVAIGQFAKRQETWFRGMERKGVKINWLSHNGSRADCEVQKRLAYCLDLIAAMEKTDEFPQS